MKIAISGSKGLLGSELVRLFKKYEFDVVEFFRPEYDITDEISVDNFFKKNLDINLFFNCAAYTDVARANQENELAFLVNSKGVENIARKCCEYNVKMVHFSTDFIFDGKTNNPYTENDVANPLNFYGSSKFEGENAIWSIYNLMGKYNYTIFRVQWLYGDNEKNFFKKIYNKAKLGEEIIMPLNEVGCPTHVGFIAEIMLHIINKNLFDKMDSQIFNLTHDDYCSRFECGSNFLKDMGFYNFSSVDNFEDQNVKRPKFTVLDNSKLKNFIEKDLGSWRDYLAYYTSTLKQKENK
jgi:dTDP-4-dehydrorhamnose reductase